jgi:hypothetical protein
MNNRPIFYFWLSGLLGEGHAIGVASSSLLIAPNLLLNLVLVKSLILVARLWGTMIRYDT